MKINEVAELIEDEAYTARERGEICKPLYFKEFMKGLLTDATFIWKFDDSKTNGFTNLSAGGDGESYSKFRLNSLTDTMFGEFEIITEEEAFLEIL